MLIKPEDGKVAHRREHWVKFQRVGKKLCKDVGQP